MRKNLDGNLELVGVDVCADVPLDILRRMLDEESRLLGQLTYVVEEIHDPIFAHCGSMAMTTSSTEGTDTDSGRSSSGAHKRGEEPPEVLTFAQYWKLFANIATLRTAQATVVGKLEKVVHRRTHLLQQRGEICSGRRLLGSSPDREREEEMSDQNDILEVFCSPAMEHYTAEHMMYTLNYSRNIAPSVIKLWQRWCCRRDKHVSAAERQELASYVPFLHFLWNAFGKERGVPSDSRVIFTVLPETTVGISSSQEQHYNKDFIFSSSMQDAPPIPSNWRGFETLLILLATPLASFRRYIHVARCLVESQSLALPVRRELRMGFVNLLAPRVEEEGGLVLDELARHDVAHIIALMDEGTILETGHPECSEKKSFQLCPDTNGNRLLVHYGRLIKRFCRGRHERLVFLFSDCFCYVEEQANGRMRLCGSISLEALQVVELDDTADMVNGFDVVTRKTRLTFFAPTPEQKQHWVDVLRNTAEEQKAKARQQTSLRGHNQKECWQPVGGGARLVHPPALSLPRASRLCQQQHADQILQRRLERLALTDPAPVQVSSAETPPAREASSAVTRKQRAVPLRSASANFDVTHWAQHSTDTVHRRMCSLDVRPTPWTLTSPHESTFVVECTTPAEASLRHASPRGRRPASTPLLISERFPETPFLRDENPSLTPSEKTLEDGQKETETLPPTSAFATCRT